MPTFHVVLLVYLTNILFTFSRYHKYFIWHISVTFSAVILVQFLRRFYWHFIPPIYWVFCSLSILQRLCSHFKRLFLVWQLLQSATEKTRGKIFLREGKEYLKVEVKFCISSTSVVSAVNHMAAWTFREKTKINKKKPSISSR